MESRNNIFCASNPARMADALWHVINTSGVAISDMLIFLPSRRAVRVVEQMLVERVGHALILPRLVALGEGADEYEDEEDEIRGADIIPNSERVAQMAQLVAADANVGTLAAALPVAHDLMRIMDYLENEGVNPSTIDWPSLVNEKYATHFQGKAQILGIIAQYMRDYAASRITVAARRNADIRAWIKYINDTECTARLIIVCASTASVPATADLMVAIANDERGRIILPGRIADENIRECDMALATNAYNSEYKFLMRIGMAHTDVKTIDVGPSAIDFMNIAFGNHPTLRANVADIAHCHLVECPREADEAAVVATITENALAENKRVLIITPDAAGGQRIRSEFDARNINADFSGGVPCTMTRAGRALLNILDDWIERGAGEFDNYYEKADHNLMETIINIIDAYGETMRPIFTLDDDESKTVWRTLWRASDAIASTDIRLSPADARAFIADALAGEVVRPTNTRNANVCVLGTIESRMQTADVVIMTGLNDGMFPARGYENAWLPRAVSEQIGLPPGDRKVSLMSLDFMNLSCNADVWWIRPKIAGGVPMSESRFISRVVARIGEDAAKEMIKAGNKILIQTAERNKAEPNPLDRTPPCPPTDTSPLSVTDLEYLIHNPYAYYVKHILRLELRPNYWDGPNALDFGNIVHDVLEHINADMTVPDLVARMDAAAHEVLGENNGVMFQFWHHRFLEIAPEALKLIRTLPPSQAEVDGYVKINGRIVHARADRIWDGGVMDIKTGTPPRDKELLTGQMPQLPIEAFIMQTGGFTKKRTDKSRIAKIPLTEKSLSPEVMFFQLSTGHVNTIPYGANETQEMITSVVNTTTELFNTYSQPGATYANNPDENARRYKLFDDLARVWDDDE